MSHISMGIAVSLSGRYSRLGRQVLEGLECYVRDVNAAGGIRPNRQESALPVSLVVEDDESDEAKVRTCTEKLIDQDRVDLLIGPYGSGLNPGGGRGCRGASDRGVESQRLLGTKSLSATCPGWSVS